MKVWEIIDPIRNKHDTADILKNNHIVKLDTYFDILEKLSNNFEIPNSWLYSSEVNESIIKTFPDESNRWNIKIQKLKKYFDIQ